MGGSSPVTHPAHFRAMATLLVDGLFCTVTQRLHGSRRQGAGFGYRDLDFAIFGTRTGVVKELRIATGKHRIGIARIIAVMENAGVDQARRTGNVLSGLRQPRSRDRGDRGCG